MFSTSQISQTHKQYGNEYCIVGSTRDLLIEREFNSPQNIPKLYYMYAFCPYQLTIRIHFLTTNLTPREKVKS